MDLQLDPQEYLEEFNEQLAAMTQHQNQALAMIFAERLRQDLRPAAQPSTWRQRLRSMFQGLTQRFVSPPQQAAEGEHPNDDVVVILDVPYTVVSPDTPQVGEPTTDKED